MGPHLGRPRVDHMKGSMHQNMKELRVQFKGDPVRILFAFDPDRRAVLFLGGTKTGDDRWYRKHVPLADQDFLLHLQEMQQEKKQQKEKTR